MGGANRTTLKELFIKHSADSYDWPKYFDSKLSNDASKRQTIKRINEATNKLEFLDKLYTYEEFDSVMKKDSTLSQLLENEFITYSEKYLKSNCAQVLI